MGLPASTSRHRYTVAEYVQIERDAKEKHEYRNGEIIAMAGGSYNHGLIAANAIWQIRNELGGKPCRVVSSDVRIRIPRTPLYTYPDASVICGAPAADPDDPSGQAVTNPRVILEVLSPSTEAYDRGEKFTHYRHLDSLEEYVLIGQTSPSIETYFRQPDGTWLFSAANDPAARIRLRSLQIELSLAEVYAGVEFPPTAEPPAPSPQ
jgi:Uma2 family endonuclease